MVHRGPDEEGFYLESNSVALGVRRLSIIDLQTGRQPIHNEDKTIWVVFNGEIYNFLELRKELIAEGHNFYTQSDTEVIVHSYEQWGDDFLLHLNGIFGLAVWDEPKCRLLLARDPFGVKPIYYRDDGRRLLWASELKSILVDPEVPRIVDRRALDLFLTFRFVPSPFTMFRGIKKIRPGHRLIFENGELLLERYYFPQPKIDHYLKEPDYIHLLRESLEAAVRRQMISDVPIGVLLSGGIDSAVILAIMSRNTKKPISTFTVGFDDGADVNELREARLTSQYFRSNHHEILLSDADYKSWLNKSIWHLEEPVATTSALPMFFVSRLAGEHVKVVLTGQGADEPLCGYHRYFGERYGHWYRRMPKVFRRYVVRPLVEALPRQERIKRAVRSLGKHDVTERFLQVYSVFDNGMKRNLCSFPRMISRGDCAAKDIVDYWRRDLKETDPLIQMAYVDARLSLADDLLMYGDKMSMASSVEARVPFLDTEYMAAAESLPASLRIRGFKRKYIHKKAISNWLPQQVIDRKKRGFETPIDRWFRSELTGYVKDRLLSDDSACSTYFNRQAVETLLDDHINGRQNNQRRLFCLLVFELWHKIFIEEKVLAHNRSPLPVL